MKTVNNSLNNRSIPSFVTGALYSIQLVCLTARNENKCKSRINHCVIVFSPLLEILPSRGLYIVIVARFRFLMSMSTLLLSGIRSQDDGKGLIHSPNVAKSIKEAELLLKIPNLDEGLLDTTGKEEGLKWIVLHVFHSDYDVRENVVKLLNLTRLSDLAEAYLWNEFKDKLSDASCPYIVRLTENLQFRDESQSIRIMSLFIKIFGKQLRSAQGTAVINALLIVIEKGLKGKEDQRIASFEAWKGLIDNFSLPPSVLGNARRTKLIVRPLISTSNAKTEKLLKVKIDVWWHLIQQLGKDLHLHIEVVVIPFLEFIFGKKKESANMAVHFIQSPIKKYSNIDIVSLDAFYRLTVPSSTIKNEDTVLPPITSLQKCGILNTKVLFTYYKELFNALEKSADLIKFGNHRSVDKFKQIFNVLSDLVHCIIEEQQHAAIETVKKIAFHFCKSIQSIIIENKRKPHVLQSLFYILEKTVAVIPNRFIFYKHNNSTILQIFLDILFHTDFIHQAKELKGTYVDIFSMILDKGSLQTFLLIQKVTLKAFSNLDGKKVKDLNEIWQNVWRLILNRMKNYVELTQEINEANSNVTHKLDTVKSILSFPIQHLMGIASKDFWKSWGEFYAICIQSAQTIVSCEGLELECFVSQKATETLKNDCELFSSHQVFIFNNYCRISTFVTQSILFDGKSSFESLRPVIEFMSELIHIASKNLLKVGGASVGVGQLTSSLMHLFSILTSPLLKPVTESTQNIVITILGSNFISAFGSAYETQVEELVEKIVNVIHSKFGDNSHKDFLNAINPLMLTLLNHSKKPIKASGHRLWQLTFAQRFDESEIPKDVASVLRKNSILSSESSMSISSLDSFTAPGLILETSLVNNTKSPLKSASLGNQQIKSSPSSTPKSPLSKSPFSSLKKKPKLSTNINDEDTQDFVPIISETFTKKRVLTEHQKEIMKSRRDDIPALYSELSRDDTTQSLNGFSNSESLNCSIEVKDELKSEDNPSLSQSLLSNLIEKHVDGKPEIDSKPSNPNNNQAENESADQSTSSSTSPNILKEKGQDISSSESAEMKESSQEDVVESSQSQNSSITTIQTRKRKRPSVNYSLSKKKPKLEGDKKMGKENKNSSRFKKSNKFGESPLQIAIKKGNFPKVFELLKDKADVNHRCHANWTPLHDSIKDGENSLAIIKLLLEHGANVNDHGGDDDNTPLHEAVLYCSTEIIQFLIDNGADPNLVNKAGEKPIDIASENAISVLQPLTLSNSSNDGPTAENPSDLKAGTRRTKRLIKPNKYVSQVNICKSTKTASKATTGEQGATSEPKVVNQDIESGEVRKEPVAEEEEKNSSVVDAVDDAINQEGRITDQIHETSDKENEKLHSKNTDSQEVGEDGLRTEIPESMEIVPSSTSSEDSNSQDKNAKPDKLISLPKPIIDCGETSSKTVAVSSPVVTASQSCLTKTVGSPLNSLHKSRAAKLIEMSKVVLVKKFETVPTSKNSPSSVFTPPAKPWQKFFPSPNASPTASILKRSHSDFSPSNKSRKVQFSDPPVSDKVEIPRKSKFNGYSEENNVTSCSLMDSSTSCTLNDDLVYSPLSECQESVSCLMKDITNKTWQKTAEKDLRDKNISTVGDLSKLSKSEACQLKGLKPPILFTLRDTLSKFDKSYKRPTKSVASVDKEDSSSKLRVSKALAPFVEVQTPEEEEKNIQEIYERPSPSPTEDAENLPRVIQDSNISRLPEEKVSVDNACQTIPMDHESQGTQYSNPLSYMDKSHNTDPISLDSKIKELLSLDKSVRWEIANKILDSLRDE